MPAVAHRGRGRRTMNEINMVPFIDVMLVLLIIFMVTAPLITPSVIDLPSVGKGAKAPEQPIIVQIRKDEGIDVKVGEKTMSVPLPDLLTAITQAQAGNAATPVVIAADKNVKYEVVVNVMDKLQRAGIQRVGLSVQVTK
jgi:biopolymer transport protein TolR